MVGEREKSRDLKGINMRKAIGEMASNKFQAGVEPRKISVMACLTTI